MIDVSIDPMHLIFLLAVMFLFPFAALIEIELRQILMHARLRSEQRRGNASLRPPGHHARGLRVIRETQSSKVQP